MKSYMSLALLALVAALLISNEVHAQEPCPEENCVSPNKCDSEIVDGKCLNKGATCCGVVKEAFRTHCRHFGGECMDKCAGPLQKRAVDCPANSICCVLV